jgi:DNA invertase Pin-like site-specific DNA recombinase
MTSADLLPAAVLKRKAVVYVRQSTQAQVQTNLESQRRQYDLVDVARQRGFRDIEVIDDDLGRSASGMVARPGFEWLVAGLCAGAVGAVLCFDASRLTSIAGSRSSAEYRRSGSRQSRGALRRAWLHHRR